MQNILLAIIAAGVVFLCVLEYQKKEETDRARVAAENAAEIAKNKKLQDLNRRVQEQYDLALAEHKKAQRAERERLNQ
jgi:hypothetical protein